LLFAIFQTHLKQYSSFSQDCCWTCKSSGMLCCIDW